MARKDKLVTDKQVLKKLIINTLRGINNLEISFEGCPVTGIFGLNGSGKTTILQTVMLLMIMQFVLQLLNILLVHGLNLKIILCYHADKIYSVQDITHYLKD